MAAPGCTRGDRTAYGFAREVAMSPDSLRQQLRVTQPGTAAGQLCPAPGSRRVFLARRSGQPGYAIIAGTAPVAPGDELVVYTLRSPSDCEHANAAFCARFYGQDGSDAPTKPWLDEEEIIASWLPRSGRRVLEICCGGGRLTPALMREGNTVLGVDSGVACVRRARALAPRGMHCCLADARRLPFPAASFDHAVCLDNSLGIFFTGQRRVLDELARCCRPGGQVILGLRTVLGAQRRLELHASHDGYLECTQTFPVSWARRLAALLEEQGVLRLRRQLPPMGSRPWGGHVHYLVLERS